MKWRAIAPTCFALAMISMPTASPAAIMQGTHSIMLGSGRIFPQGYMVNETGPVNSNAYSGPGTYQVNFTVNRPRPSFLIQYLYQLSPSLGLGINSAFHSLYSDEALAKYINTPSIVGGYDTNGSVIEAIPVARYTWRSSHSINPYVTGGLGAHYSYLSSRVNSGSWGTPPNWTTPQTHVSSIGLSVLVGAGLEMSIEENFLIGSEVRWTTMNPFGNALGAFGWLGWKWVAPL